MSGWRIASRWKGACKTGSRVKPVHETGATGLIQPFGATCGVKLPTRCGRGLKIRAYNIPPRMGCLVSIRPGWAIIIQEPYSHLLWVHWQLMWVEHHLYCQIMRPRSHLIAGRAGRYTKPDRFLFHRRRISFHKTLPKRYLRCSVLL